MHATRGAASRRGEGCGGVRLGRTSEPEDSSCDSETLLLGGAEDEPLSSVATCEGLELVRELLSAEGA